LAAPPPILPLRLNPNPPPLLAREPAREGVGEGEGDGDPSSNPPELLLRDNPPLLEPNPDPFSP